MTSALGTKARHTKGALLEILETGFGAVLLAIVGLGLLGYAVWRVFQGAT